MASESENAYIDSLEKENKKLKEEKANLIAALNQREEDIANLKNAVKNLVCLM